MKHHPITKLFPPLSGAEYESLKQSIKDNGLRNPIWTWKGEVIDGAHRDCACEELGVPIRTQEWDGNGSLAQFAWDQNAHRRHLDLDQLAAVAAEFAKALESEGLQKKQEGGKKAGRGRPQQVETNSSQPNDRAPQAREQAAQTAGVGTTKVQEAIKIQEVAPELHEKVKQGEMTHAQAKNEVKRREKRQDLIDKAANATANGKVKKPDIREGDCLKELAKLKPGTVRLVFADPPYNEAIDYGPGKKDDQLPVTEYLDWCRQWIEACASALTADGSFWVLISNRHAAAFEGLLVGAGLFPRAWITWYESFGVNCENNFNRTSRRLLYFVKDPKEFVFHASAVSRPSDRQVKYEDARADPGGKLWDDVWGINPPIPRLTGTCDERLPDFPTQLPLALLRPIVGCASDPGDLILDPFNGSGTTGAACIELGRSYIGIEQNLRYVELASLRLKGICNGNQTL